MSTPSPFITTTTVINTAIPSSSFEKVKNAYDHGDNDEIIRQATSTIAHIEQLVLLSILVQRAHALSMKSKFGAAAQDAETMIKYAPTLPQGYLCFGKLLTMQGKQTRALIVYQEGLEKVPTNDPAYGQLLQAKKMADEKNNKRFDLVSALPLEVKDEIVSLLLEEERADLFDVSTTWSRRLENCQKAWRYIYNKHGYYGDIAVSRVLPKIAKHISDLIITTTEDKVWLKYLEHLENGQFRNLRSLQLTDHRIYIVFSGNSVISLMDGFWKARYTLTKIDLLFSKRGSPITITDILFYLPYLETLVLDTPELLADILGDLESIQEPHHSLVDLTLDTERTAGDALKRLTKWCPYVKRLRLEYAQSTALDVVNDYFPNVEMLGYNNGYKLPESHKVLNQEYNNNKPIIPIISMNNMYTKQKQGRLRAFYSVNDGLGVPGEEFLRILQKNQKTLEIIHANMGMTEQQMLDDELHNNFRPDYSIEAASVILNLDRLKKIMFWPDIYGVYERLFCRMIRPSLEYFKLTKTSDLPAVVDMLINSQQLFETLGLSRIFIINNDQENGIATQCLVRLFNEYAATSLPGPNTTKKLTYFMFDCCSFISDDVLDALANVRTIKGLSFQGNTRITPQGLKNFFIKLNKQNVQITELRLAEMGGSMDNKTLLDIISTMRELEALYLGNVHGLRDNDIKELINNAKKLDNLTVKRCHVDPEEIITFVNNTSRNFKYLNIHEYESDNDILTFDFDAYD
ncbi:hypothetical protein INT45_006732 [Circinella minor]|uniref:F-box domain-containing protein n=1 Tax=Circinella minor TaxID=1195481 RepID=A0A8H7VEJ3_9FUNG|nr:hypothetical protein INT45_006732 [Circinella minor]